MTPKPPRRPPQRRMSRNLLGWVISAMAVAVLAGYFAGFKTGGSSPSSAGQPLGAAGSPGAAGGPVDLASMSPEERAGRLYDRVMSFAEQGHLDSARVFAPMALQAYASLGKLDAHRHYDVGMIWAAVGDSARGRSEAGAILKERPTHLLGLLLAMRTAASPARRAAYERRFVDASKAELAAALPEYEEHKSDIDTIVAAAKPAKK